MSFISKEKIRQFTAKSHKTLLETIFAECALDGKRSKSLIFLTTVNLVTKNIHVSTATPIGNKTYILSHLCFYNIPGQAFSVFNSHLHYPYH